MKDINNEDWENEQKRVNFVVREIITKANKLKKNAGKVRSDALEIRETFWQDVTANFDEPDDIVETFTSIKQQAELLSERERTNTQLGAQIKTLARLKENPYFGRIDFYETGEEAADTIYLGIASFLDQKDENFLIYDWRAPISSLYYDYQPGPARYNTPEGIIEGHLDLKRQFIIRNSNIKGMFETGVTIGDEMLQEVLGNNASTQMKSIVATIQKEQNAIIRNDHSKIIVVKGVAGSGKTSAALQRVAYLLYRNRGLITSENIMLFSPNPLFNSYVATVLPELGEENMQQTTFQEYLSSRIGKEFNVEDPFIQMEYLLTHDNQEHYKTRISGIRFKAGNEFISLMDCYVEELSECGLIFRDIVFRGDIIISKDEINNYFYSLERNHSIPNRMELVKDWLLKEMKKQMRQEMSKSWVEDEIQFLEKEDYMEAFKQLEEKLSFTENSFNDFEQEQKLLARMVVKEKFKPLFTKIKKLKFLDLHKLYMCLFEKPFARVETFPKEWDRICAQTLETLAKKIIQYEDVTPLAYLQDMIEGSKAKTGVRHIFIDEAQDYTPFQFAFIQKLYPYSKMTLLGDYNQAIYSGATGSATVLSDKEFNGDETEIYELMRTYRSTKPIVEFTKAFLPEGDKIEPFNRNGEKPQLLIVPPVSLDESVIRKLTALQELGHKTIAVICKTAKESKTAFEAIKGSVPCRLIEKGTLSYERGISVIPSYLAKGIEFDAVILYDITQYKDESERKLFYTACTRAMHELHLFAPGTISPLLRNVDETLYEVVK
ncbi:MAG: RNA polymerase recycling motor HelD [Bacillota bacterium]|nr:RNA polymerase recycling motor HelD [Bacillota bacterium]